MRHSPAKWRLPQPRSSMNSSRSAAEPRVLPRPLGSVRDPAGQRRNRSVRSIPAATPVPVPASACIDGGSRIQHSPRICLGIPIAYREEERHEATTRTRAPEPKTLSLQTSRRASSLSPGGSVTRVPGSHDAISLSNPSGSAKSANPWQTAPGVPPDTPPRYTSRRYGLPATTDSGRQHSIPSDR